MEGYIDLKKISIEELAGVVNLYPWFGAARKELCERMSKAGGGDWGYEQYADAALYVGSRRIIADIVRSSRKEDCADAALSVILKRISNEFKPKQVRVAGGDYFTQEQYDRVRKEEDVVFSGFSSANAVNEHRESPENAPDLAFYTETLAQIYADQGYCDRARDIYSKLILAYPEKNAYFAALIEKLDSENQTKR